ncbi:MAG: CapA family protein, partial [Anaerolineales bacterium]|nr:CapA family protein [Anaerolineales bacterium]
MASLAACDPFEPDPTLIPTENAGFEVYVPVVSVLTATPFQPSQGAGYPPPGNPSTTQGGVGAPITGANDSLSLWVGANLPPSVREALVLPDILTAAPAPESASLTLETGDSAVVSRVVYALVAPFPTIEDGVDAAEVRKAWRGNAEGPFAGLPLLVDQDTLDVFTTLWGNPAQGAVRVAASDQLADQAWESRPAWALVPFDDLDPRWKVLTVGDISPVRKEFKLEEYALAAPLSLSGDRALVDSILALHGAGTEAPMLPAAANRDPDKLTTVVMTGVTALVRATAFTMERQGNLHPAVDIGPWLREADILHISNEVPFAANSPFPNPTQEGLRFCSDPKYIELMEDIGTDVVELTGDHFQDWGAEAMYLTLEMYRERGWPYYGGGENREDARKAVIFEHNGNKLAFIGCNRKGGGYAGASNSAPGAVS